MSRWKYIGLLIACLGIFTAQAQDIHFSQYHQVPLMFNPSTAGNFNGDYRFTGIYRNQWATVPVPFNSTGASFDMKVVETKKFNSFLGGGINLLYDNAGDGNLRTLYAQIPLSYQISIPVNNSFINVAAGAGIGWLQKSINTAHLAFDAQFTGEVFDPSLPTNEQFNQTSFGNLDVSMGYLFSVRTSNDLLFSLGFGAHHMNKLSETFLNNGNAIDLNKRYSIPLKFGFPINRKWDLQLDYLFQEQGSKSEMLFGGMATYYLKKNLPAQKAISFGSRYRIKDALIAVFNYRVNNFNAGISYDINLSPLNAATKTYGGVELTAVYIIQKVKSPNIKNKRQCFVF